MTPRQRVRAVYEGKDWSDARKKIEASLDQMSLPPGYGWSFGERIQRQDEQTQQMLVNYALALVLVYIVMASQRAPGFMPHPTWLTA